MRVQEAEAGVVLGYVGGSASSHPRSQRFSGLCVEDSGLPRQACVAGDGAVARAGPPAEAGKKPGIDSGPSAEDTGVRTVPSWPRHNCVGLLVYREEK